MTEAVFEGLGVKAHEHEEGPTTKMIEQYTSQIPSGFYLGLAFGAVGASLGLRLMGRDRDSQFVGHWVAPLLIMGLYNKIVRLQGSD